MRLRMTNEFMTITTSGPINVVHSIYTVEEITYALVGEKSKEHTPIPVKNNEVLAIFQILTSSVKLIWIHSIKLYKKTLNIIC